MIAAVLDVNALASGIVGRPRQASTPGELIRRWLNGYFELVVSQHIVNGLRRTLSKPRFDALLTQQEIIDALVELQQRARVAPIAVPIAGVAPDEEDDQVLATAISAGVPYLVTGDRAFLQLGAYRGVQLLSPRAFLAVLDDARAESAGAP